MKLRLKKEIPSITEQMVKDSLGREGGFNMEQWMEIQPYSTPEVYEHFWKIVTSPDGMEAMLDNTIQGRVAEGVHSITALGVTGFTAGFCCALQALGYLEIET